jgi:hypothetical protein
MNARKHKGLPPQYRMQIAPVPDTGILVLSQSDRGVGVPSVIFIVTVAIVGAFCAGAPGQFAKALVGLYECSEA